MKDWEKDWEKDWDLDSMTVESHRGASIAIKKLGECYSSEGESNYYKQYYYIDKLASYGHVPSIKTLELMRQDGVGCDRTLERKQEGVWCDKTLGTYGDGVSGD